MSLCKFLTVLKPVRKRSVLVMICILAICTYLMSIQEITFFERKSRERMESIDPKKGPTEPIENTKHTIVKRLEFLEAKPKTIKRLVFPKLQPHVNTTKTKKPTVKTIAWLFPPHWIKPNTFSVRCKSGKSCYYSSNTSLIATADAVVAEGRHNFLSERKPPPRMPGQVYVFFMMEPPPYVSIAKEWTSVFNWTISYRQDSDIMKPYGELRPNKTHLSEEYFKSVMKMKTKAVAWIVSRCHSQGKREQYVKELSKYIQVDVYGRCGPLKCDKNCYNTLKSYRFFLAFENSFCSDYVTEKFFKTFKYDIVPVVRGGADYNRLFPKNILINTANFDSVEALAKQLNYLMKNDGAYLNILKNKHKHYVAFPVPWCDLCIRLHDAQNHKKEININDWLNQGKCVKPTDIVSKFVKKIKN